MAVFRGNMRKQEILPVYRRFSGFQMEALEEGLALLHTPLPLRVMISAVILGESAPKRTAPISEEGAMSTEEDPIVL